MPLVTSALAAAGARALGRPAPRRLALRAAAARGRSLVLVYHRVTPGGARPGDVVPAVPAALFRRQLEALQRAGDVVPLAALLTPARRPGRPRFAVTFDDDEPAHVRHALPVLQALGVPATFFLMGRALHDLGPPWWVRLEAAVARHGLAAVARALGTPAGSAAELAARCEGTPLAAEVARTFPPPDGDGAQLDAGDMRALAAAGMTVGFHTVEHPPLPLLDDADLARALDTGRLALARAAGAPVDLIAYPHGRADARVAAFARAAGYRAAWRTGGRPVSSASDPFLLGRWEPGPLPPDVLLAWAALRLNRPAGGPSRSSTPATGAPAGGGPR